MSDFDVVIIGAGNSGISAALQLANAGKKTLLIEQHNMPGGCASSFIRGRFEFEPSLHELCDVGSDYKPGEIKKLFSSYGVNDIEWLKVPDCFRVISKYSSGKDMDVVMPSGIEKFKLAIEKEIPGSLNIVEELFELFKETQDGLAYISSTNGHPDIEVLKDKYPNFIETGAYPVKKVFDSLDIPQEIQDIFSTYWVYLGVDIENLAFLHYATMVYKYIEQGAYIPKHTSHEISLKLIERLKELGGEVWFNCRANKILFNGNKVRGVETTQGVISCKHVLADINSDIVYGKMVPKELIPERLNQLYAARESEYSGRMFTVYLGLDRDYRELGIKDYNTFISETSNSALQYEKIMRGVDKNNFAIFLCYNVINNEASPFGTCMCSITTIVAPEDWDNLKDQKYINFKGEFANKLIKLVEEKMGIDIINNIEEISIATPLTFARYLNVPEGSVYGHPTKTWDGIMARLQSIKEDNPLTGLKIIGADGPRGDGYSSTYLTGQLMANLTIKELNESESENAI